ncbi:class B sortase [Butyrivibrio proteoclasticus]|uniref:class B sortase n=1 Tax=Butyrivibrio proteoclasticus TaxID=43305 RepID=UPI000684C2B4|nr:class B sortase [Butyrivibrio proteoclasticus]
MKKRVVSILIAGILFFSNIGVTSFAANNSSGEASSAASSASTEGSTVDAQKKSNEGDYGEDEISYYKITDFSDLPENISNQKIRVGGKLEDLELPDSLEVTVEPDYEHDERIERGLAQERERLRKEREEQDKEKASDEASSNDSDDESEAASSASSGEDDGEKIIFFDDGEDVITDDPGKLSGEEESDSAQEETTNDSTTITEEPSPTSDSSETNNTDTDKAEKDKEKTDKEANDNVPSESSSAETSNEGTSESSEETSDGASENSLISWLTHTFRNAAVAYAADVKDSKSSDKSVEIISDVEWVLEPEYNYGTEEFSADEEGKIYLFTPVLLIPDTYYIEDELPIITVTVTDDYYAFDKEVVVDDVKIRVRADKGVFPEGSRVTARKLAEEDEQKVKELVDEQVGTDKVVKEYTFDITVKDEDGDEVQPDTEKGRVVVSFEAAEVADVELEAEVFHIIDEYQEEEKPEAEVAVALGGERAKERVTTIYNENSILKVEKLESEVVEIDDAKVIEAETSGFSSYSVIFKAKEDDAEDYPLTTANIVLVEDILDKVFKDGTPGEIVKVDTTSAKDYLHADTLSSPDATGDGMFSHDDAGDWYLIVKRPFNKEQKIKVTYYDSTEDKNKTVDITVVNNMEIDPTVIENEGFPTATELTDTNFRLVVPTYQEVDDTDNVIDKVLLYQWQSSTDNKSWKDIPLANDAVFGSTDGSLMWYRCCVNGKYSESVQIVTKNSDKRTWTDFTDADQRYVSNGVMAYTTLETNKLDVVGEFTSGGKKYMLQTTFGGRGWTLHNDETPNPATPDPDVYGNLEKIWFSFDKATKAFRVAAYLKDDYPDFAITANSEIGDTDQNTALATVSEGELLKLAVVGAKTQVAIQNAINSGTGNNIPSLLITPKTKTGLEYHIGDTGTQEAYQDDDETLIEETIPGVSVSWELESLTNKVVKFDFKLAGASTNKILPAVSKRATSNTYSSGSIKSVKLNGNTLDSYAKRLGEPTEEILIEMKNGAASSTDKTAISNILPTYVKANTSSTTTTTSSSSTSTSSTSGTKYTADYYGVTFTYTKGGKATVNEDGFYKDKAELPVILTEEISYDFKEKEDIRVYRCHDGEARELSSDNPGGDGTFKIDTEAGKIYVYASNYSSFAVAYKPETYYTVTFNDGTNTWTVKVKAGEKVAAPEAIPVKEGYTFMGWYLKGSAPTTSSSSSSSSSSKTTSTTTSNATPYNFDTPVNSNISITAGFTSNKDDPDKKDPSDSEEDEDENGSRAPGTGDTLPPVWLWVLILIGGAVAFSCNLYARAKEGKVKFSDNKTVRKITRVFLLLGLVIVTVARFLIKKVNEKKRETALVLSGAVVLIAAGVLIFTSIEYHRSEKAYGDASKTYVQETQEIPLSASVTDEVNSTDNSVWWNEASVEMETLTEEYPDAIGWIYFENEDISYPIMYSGDNTKYLNTSYDGEKARAGAIFLDGESTPDFSDPHSLIYGHNMRDLTMFGKLRFYKTDASYYDEHQYFQIFTKDGVYRYQIFAYEEVPDSHDVFWVYGKDPEGMWEMLQDIEGGSYRQTGIEATESDHVITLATCTSKEDRRLIVSALRTDEHDYEYVASN